MCIVRRPSVTYGTNYLFYCIICKSDLHSNTLLFHYFSMDTMYMYVNILTDINIILYYNYVIILYYIILYYIILYYIILYYIILYYIILYYIILYYIILYYIIYIIILYYII